MNVKKLIAVAAGLTTKALAAVVAASAMAALPSQAATAPDFVTSEAVFWLDASTLSETVGTELNSWADVRGGSYPGVTTYIADCTLS